LYKNNKFLWQDDKDGKHTQRATQEFIKNLITEECYLSHELTPSKFADVWPIERAWRKLKCELDRVKARKFRTSKT